MVEVFVNAEGKVLQVRFERMDNRRIKRGELIGITLWQDGIVGLPAHTAWLARDVLPLPVDQMDVQFLLEGIEQPWKEIVLPFGRDDLHWFPLMPSLI